MFIRGSYIAARFGTTSSLHANHLKTVIPASCGQAHDGLARFRNLSPALFTCFDSSASRTLYCP